MLDGEEDLAVERQTAAVVEAKLVWHRWEVGVDGPGVLG
jgi:hypothetical protein